MSYLSDIEADAAAGLVAEAQPELGSDERRMQVRAYNHWLSLIAEEQSYPGIEELDLDHEEFGPPGVLVDFTSGFEEPAIGFVGATLRAECRIEDDIKLVRDVPGRSLLSRLTDHCLQAVANEAPVGFEAEFTTGDGREVQYRGILLPFSSTGDSIDFVYGVLSWKNGEEPSETQPAVKKKSRRAAERAASQVEANSDVNEVAATTDTTAPHLPSPEACLPDMALAAAYAEIGRLNDALTAARQQLAAAQGEADKARFIISSLRDLVRLS